MKNTNIHIHPFSHMCVLLHSLSLWISLRERWRDWKRNKHPCFSQNNFKFHLFKILQFHVRSCSKEGVFLDIYTFRIILSFWWIDSIKFQHYEMLMFTSDNTSCLKSIFSISIDTMFMISIFMIFSYLFKLSVILSVMTIFCKQRVISWILLYYTIW